MERHQGCEVLQTPVPAERAISASYRVGRAKQYVAAISEAIARFELVTSWAGTLFR